MCINQGTNTDWEAQTLTGWHKHCSFEMLYKPCLIRTQNSSKMCLGEEDMACGQNRHENELPESALKMSKNPFQALYSRNLDIPEGRTIYLSRHGESEYNLEDRIGGDSNLTPRGQQYAKSLGPYMKT